MLGVGGLSACLLSSICMCFLVLGLLLRIPESSQVETAVYFD